MTNREKLIVDFVEQLKTFDNANLAEYTYLSADNDFCCNHCTFRKDGKSCDDTVDKCIGGIRAWLVQKEEQRQ